MSSFLAVAGAAIGILVITVLYFVLTFRRRVEDVTRATTEELYLSRERFRELYENGPVPYLLLSLNGAIEQPNLAALRLFGTHKNEISGAHFVGRFFEEDRKEIEQFIEFLNRRLPVHDREVRVRKKNGAIRWVLLSIFILGNGEDKAHQGLVTLVDITERKEIERTKNEFVSLASHQLRTPLALMKWYAEALLEGDAGELSLKQKDYTERIYKNNERMIELVTALLNISRLEMGTMVPKNEATDARQIADDVYAELAMHAEEKGIRVEREYEEGFPLLYTDSKFLRIVVQNLLSNAVKYTPHGGTVRIILERKDEEARIIVRDTGHGIPPDEQEKIFTKMFRARNAQSMDADGNGLGLYMARSIVELLGGAIHFDSELGKGTTFIVTLPIGAPSPGRFAEAEGLSV